MDSEFLFGRIVAFDLFPEDDTGKNLGDILSKLGFERDTSYGPNATQVYKLIDHDCGRFFLELEAEAKKRAFDGISARLLDQTVDEVALSKISNAAQTPTIIPMPIVILTSTLKNEYINITDKTEIWKTILNVGTVFGMFLQKNGGLSGKLNPHYNSAPYALELNVVMNEDSFEELKSASDEMHRKKMNQNPPASHGELIALSEKLRNLEPISFFATNMNIDSHSIIVGIDNLAMIVGCMRQPGGGGFLYPYLLKISADRNASFFQSPPSIFTFYPAPGAGIPDFDALIDAGASAFVIPLLTEIWLRHLSPELTDSEMKLRGLIERTSSAISSNSSSQYADSVNELLPEINSQSVALAATVANLEFVERCQRDGLIIGTSHRRSGFYSWFMSEIGYPSKAPPFYEEKMTEGYFNTLTSSIERGISNTLSKAQAQEKSILTIQENLMIFVQRNMSNVQLRLSRRLNVLTIALVVLTVVEVIFLPIIYHII